MNLSVNLTLDEFTTTQHRSIDNSLPDELLDQANLTAQLLERVRSALGNNPMHVSSGYRCPELNASIGSASTSDHIKAMAIDFTCPDFGSPLAVAQALEPLVDELEIGQLIYEQTWIHISTRTPDKAVNRILTMQHGHFSAGINP